MSKKGPDPVGVVESRWASKIASQTRRRKKATIHCHQQGSPPLYTRSSGIPSPKTRKRASRDDWPLSRETQPKLLSVLLQVALYSVEFVRVGWAKPSVLVDIDNPAILKMYD